MKALRLLFVGPTPEIYNHEFWQVWTKSLNLDIQMDTSDEFPEKNVLAKLHYHGVRCADNFMLTAFKNTKGATPMLVQLQVVDYFYLKNKEYWPKLLLREGLHAAILKKHPNLSTQEGGLIVGTGRDAKLAASVLIELGFDRITFVDNDEHVAKDFLTDLKKNYFQIKFDLITTDKVILLPGVYSVIVNTWDIGKESELLTDLLYFNYLKEPGLVINLKRPLGSDALIEEAKAINEKTIERNEIEIFVEIQGLRPFVELNENQINDLLSNRP